MKRCWSFRCQKPCSPLRCPHAVGNPALHHHRSEILSSPQCNVLPVSTDSTALLTHRRLDVAHSHKHKNRRIHKQRDTLNLKHENIRAKPRELKQCRQLGKKQRQKSALAVVSRGGRRLPNLRPSLHGAGARTCGRPYTEPPIGPEPMPEHGVKPDQTTNYNGKLEPTPDPMPDPVVKPVPTPDLTIERKFQS